MQLQAGTPRAGETRATFTRPNTAPTQAVVDTVPGAAPLATAVVHRTSGSPQATPDAAAMPNGQPAQMPADGGIEPKPLLPPVVNEPVVQP
jgi:hypothetical protein